jgi:hypothetical protein
MQATNLSESRGRWLNRQNLCDRRETMERRGLRPLESHTLPANATCRLRFNHVPPCGGQPPMLVLFRVGQWACNLEERPA